MVTEHARVAARTLAGGGLVELWLMPDAAAASDVYRFGQYLVVEHDAQRGYFAIAGHHSQRGFRVIVRPQPGFSSVMAALSVGDTVRVSAPQGAGFAATAGSPWFVVVGSGIGAVLGWIHHLAQAGAAPNLIYGVYSCLDCPVRADLVALQRSGAQVVLCESGSMPAALLATVGPHAGAHELSCKVCTVQQEVAAQLAIRAHEHGESSQEIVVVGPNELIVSLQNVTGLRVMTNL
jgi:ferredoxin-NADP reductase